MSVLPFRAPYGQGPETEPLVRIAGLRPVAGCPHETITNWRPWPGFDVEIGECVACGTTISREAE